MEMVNYKLKRDAVKMLEEKGILTNQEKMSCLYSIFREAETNKLYFNEDRNYATICELENSTFSEGTVDDKYPTVIFPFFITNKTDDYIMIKDLNVKMITSKGKRVTPGYHLTRTGPTDSDFVIEPNNKILFGPTEKFSELDNELDDLLCRVSYCDITNAVRVVYSYRLNNKTIWQKDGMKIFKGYSFYIVDDLKRFLEERIEEKMVNKEQYGIVLDNFSFEVIENGENASLCFHGAINKKENYDEQAYKIKTIFYDIQGKIMIEEYSFIQTDTFEDYNTFKINFSKNSKTYWNSVGSVRVLLQKA